VCKAGAIGLHAMLDGEELSVEGSGADKITWVVSTHFQHIFSIVLEKLKREGSGDAHVGRSEGKVPVDSERAEVQAPDRRSGRPCLLNGGMWAHKGLRMDRQLMSSASNAIY
jgi:hypothetical protein